MGKVHAVYISRNTDILIYILIPQNRSISETQTGFQLVQNSPHFMESESSFHEIKGKTFPNSVKPSLCIGMQQFSILCDTTQGIICVTTKFAKMCSLVPTTSLFAYNSRSPDTLKCFWRQNVNGS